MDELKVDYQRIISKTCNLNISAFELKPFLVSKQIYKIMFQVGSERASEMPDFFLLSLFCQCLVRTSHESKKIVGQG